MTQLAMIAFPRELVMPTDAQRAARLVGCVPFFNAMVFLAMTLRDSMSPISMYEGDDISDTIENYFCDDRNVEVMDYYETCRDEIIAKATVMEQLLPDGLYEMMAYWDTTATGVFYTAVIHYSEFR